MMKQEDMIKIGAGLVLGYLLLRSMRGGGGSVPAGQSFLSMDCSIPRGIRNNNPGNIKTSSAAWQGKIPFQDNNDVNCSTGQVTRTFEQFITYEYGIRALVKLLETYMKTHGLRTVRGIINRWAPTSENNTSAYVNTVSNRMGITPDVPLQFTRETMRLLSQAIAWVENGRESITDAQFYSMWSNHFGGIAGPRPLADFPREGGAYLAQGRRLYPNEPVPSHRSGKKRMVLASKNGMADVLHYGHSDYEHNYSPQAQQAYCNRSAGIRNGQGQLTKNDIFSPNHWSRTDLWECD